MPGVSGESRGRCQIGPGLPLFLIAVRNYIGTDSLLSGILPWGGGKRVKKWTVRSLLIAVFLSACALRVGTGIMRDKYKKEAEFFAKLEQDSLQIAERMEGSCVELRGALVKARKRVEQSRAKLRIGATRPAFSQKAFADLEQDIAQREALARSSRLDAEKARRWRRHYQRLSNP